MSDGFDWGAVPEVVPAQVYEDDHPKPGPMLDGEILFGDDAVVRAMVAALIPEEALTWAHQPTVALGVVRRDILVGGVVFHDYTGANMSVTCAMTDPRWASRTNLRKLFGYAFDGHPGLCRMTAITKFRNKRTRSVLEKMGFKLEGKIRQAFGPRDDGLLYGMLRSECKWIA